MLLIDKEHSSTSVMTRCHAMRLYHAMAIYTAFIAATWDSGTARLGYIAGAAANVPTRTKKPLSVTRSGGGSFNLHQLAPV